MQIGDTCPDVDDIAYIGKAFNAVQALIDKRVVASGHDISDGGIIVTLLEMAFAGNCGINVDLPPAKDHTSHDAPFATLFAEELGLLVEVCLVPNFHPQIHERDICIGRTESFQPYSGGQNGY